VFTFPGRCALNLASSSGNRTAKPATLASDSTQAIHAGLGNQDAAGARYIVASSSKSRCSNARCHKLPSLEQQKLLSRPPLCLQHFLPLMPSSGHAVLPVEGCGAFVLQDGQNKVVPLWTCKQKCSLRRRLCQ
jgi:hypothetical protein